MNSLKLALLIPIFFITSTFGKSITIAIGSAVGSKLCQASVIDLGIAIPGYNRLALVTAAHCLATDEEPKKARTIKIKDGSNIYAEVESVVYANSEINTKGFQLLKHGEEGEVQYCQRYYQDDLVLVFLKGIFPVSDISRNSWVNKFSFSLQNSQSFNFKGKNVSLNDKFIMATDAYAVEAIIVGNSGAELTTNDKKIVGLASCFTKTKTDNVERKFNHFSRWNQTLSNALNK